MGYIFHCICNIIHPDPLSSTPVPPYAEKDLASGSTPPSRILALAYERNQSPTVSGPSLPPDQSLSSPTRKQTLVQPPSESSYTERDAG